MRDLPRKDIGTASHPVVRVFGSGDDWVAVCLGFRDHRTGHLCRWESRPRPLDVTLRWREFHNLNHVESEHEAQAWGEDGGGTAREFVMTIITAGLIVALFWVVLWFALTALGRV